MKDEFDYQGKIEQLEAALINYIERYGLSDGAREAFAQDEGMHVPRKLRRPNTTDISDACAGRPVTGMGAPQISPRADTDLKSNWLHLACRPQCVIFREPKIAAEPIWGKHSSFSHIMS